MYLKRIEIAGFKSFANKTVVDFEATDAEKSADGAFDDEKRGSGIGLTAIVGPNGSGKSNIADAILWAMGEQSMKNLRGKKVEDIIFAGSDKKGKLNYATVALHFDNSDKKIPIDYSEVIIRRKLFRNGDSEYIINKNKVRLMDVIDLLAKAGIGKDSYSVLNQGMSDAMLNATPTERRAIFEDAAGVKQYQIKKIRALKKLETTRRNLAQVNVLLNEIEPHLKSLKRQANKARKGKELKVKLKEMQEKYFAFLWADFQQKQSKFFEEKERLGNEMMRLQKEVDKLNDFVLAESKKTRQSNEVDKLKLKRDKIYREIGDLERELMIADGKIEITNERIKQQNIIRNIPVDKRYIQNELEKILREYENLLSLIQVAKEVSEIEILKKKAEEIGARMSELKRHIKKGEVEGKKTEEQIKKEKELKQIVAQIEKEKKSLQEKIERLKKENRKVVLQIEKEIKKDEIARQKLFSAEDTLREKQRKLSFLKDKFNEAKVSLARIEVREEDLIADAKRELHIDIRKLKYDGEAINASETERKIFRIKSQLEQIGGIDPLIIDEYEETNKRYQTLQQESADLEKAIVSLKEIAKEMEKKIEKEFSTAFKEINKEFSKYFKIIFGGGKAKLHKIKVEKTRKTGKEKQQTEKENEAGKYFNTDMRMSVGEQDYASETNMETELNDNIEQKTEEIGVEVDACPPGKKISNLAMLSGGERSLTALALLFAIISYNPPPFVVLDEVEAALDESNSVRFGKILRDLSANTQFIAITHNRETMRQASCLYGATMNNDGITKLLSVKLK